MDMRYQKGDSKNRPRPREWYDFHIDESLDEEFACVYFNAERNQAYVALKGELSVSTMKQVGFTGPERLEKYRNYVERVRQKYKRNGQDFTISISGHSNGALNLTNLLINGEDLSDFHQVSIFNAPRVRDFKREGKTVKWGQQVDEYLIDKPKNIYFMQTQFDFGTGSLMGKFPENTFPSEFDPYLHFTNINTMTVAYPGQTKGMPWKPERFENSSRADRAAWGLEQHLWEHFKRPRIDYTRNVNLPIGIRDAFVDVPQVQLSDSTPNSIFRDGNRVFKQRGKRKRDVEFIPEIKMAPIDEAHEARQWKADKDYSAAFERDMDQFDSDRGFTHKPAPKRQFSLKGGVISDWSYPDRDKKSYW